MANALSTRRRVRKPQTLAAVLVAVALHGGVFVTAQLFGLTWITDGVRAALARTVPPADETELKASCFNNAAFTTSGRHAMCFAPWVKNVDDCLNDAQMGLWIDLSGCQARNDPGTAITMIEPRAAEKVTPIDPEKLLDEFKAAPEKADPPAGRGGSAAAGPAAVAAAGAAAGATEAAAAGGRDGQADRREGAGERPVPVRVQRQGREADRVARRAQRGDRSEEHTSELQSRLHLVCRLLLEK